jgi:hypothetical protein
MIVVIVVREEMVPRLVTLEGGEPPPVAIMVMESTLTLTFTLALTPKFGSASELEFRLGFGWWTLVGWGVGYP